QGEPALRYRILCLYEHDSVTRIREEAAMYGAVGARETVGYAPLREPRLDGANPKAGEDYDVENQSERPFPINRWPGPTTERGPEFRRRGLRPGRNDRHGA